MLVKQLRAISFSDSNNLITSERILAQADKVSSSGMLWVETFSMNQNKSLIKILKRISTTMEPWGTPEILSKKFFPN